MINKSLSIKILAIIVIILIFGIGALITFYNIKENADLRENAEEKIDGYQEIIYQSISNIMLAYTGDSAVKLMDDIRESNPDLKRVKIFRTDGVEAFVDDSTIQMVNQKLAANNVDMQFDEKNLYRQPEMSSNPKISEVISSASGSIMDEEVVAGETSLTFYRTLNNTTTCYSCHGSEHSVRGVIILSTSMQKTIDSIKNSTYLSIVIFFGIVIILSVVMILFMRRVVVNPLLTISSVVDSVGEGDLSKRVSVKNADEIGKLANRINEMIKGLYERLQLTKFVSRSTVKQIADGSDIVLGGQRKVMTVLFSDIRGFTSFSEKNPPERVMEVLNLYMKYQADIISNFDGDIDKFVGDEIMAVFEGHDMELRAVTAAYLIIKKIVNLNKENNLDIKIGIGINTGQVVSGNMGSLDRIDFTVIGDNVNLGSRLCSAAGPNTIILSESTFLAVEKNVEVQRHDPITVKGKKEPVPIYTLIKVINPAIPSQKEE